MDIDATLVKNHSVTEDGQSVNAWRLVVGWKEWGHWATDVCMVAWEEPGNE